ncbi:multi-sensor signal transduction histidine kinase [endosymbiont of Acanthamoeba sp. UWC8]|nr:multi-sensor signal transduction histidine kinase [endosymbiont of Acanthamoeba sp. UWC8]
MKAKNLFNLKIFKKSLLNLTKRFSLANLHLHFSVCVVIITVCVSIIFAVLKYKEFQKEKNYYLLEQSYKLNIALYEKISFAENMVKFLAEKIIQSGDYSYSNIAFLVKHQRENFKKDTLAWTLIHYVNPEHYMVVDSIMGVRQQPINLSSTKRSWIEAAFEDPWKLKFSKPDFGLITRQRVLSTALGMQAKNKFIGYLSIAIYLAKIAKSLQSVVDKNVSFILLDTEGNFLLASDRSINEQSIKIPEALKYEVFRLKHSNSYLLSKPIKIGNHIFTLKMNTENYPFIFLVGQDTVNYYEQFKQEIIPHIIKNITLGVVFITILLFLSYIVVRPIIELSNAADNISKGANVEIPEYEALELNNLASQLANIQNITKDLRLKQAELTKANENLRNANEFIQSNMSFLSHELRNPISSIIGFAKLLKKKLSDAEDKENKEYTEFIYNIAVHQDKQINFFLKLFEFQERGKKLEYKEINLTEVIQSNINMVMHHANKKGVRVILNIAPDLPNMIGDDIMIGQMVQNFATNGAKYNKQGGSLEVKAFTRVRNRKKEIVIQFKDTGIGIEEKDLKKLFKKFERIQNDRNVGVMGYGLGLAFAKTCVIAHDGEINVVSEPGKGTVFSISFPRARIVEKL